jgi:hypothetical protein
MWLDATLDPIKAQKLMEVENLSKSLTVIHAKVGDKAPCDRKAAIQKQNDKTHARSSNFQVRDCVLAAEHRKSGMYKLQMLCVSKDETSVDIMCRRFCSNFLRKSRL